jgi:cardiolipin synthase
MQALLDLAQAGARVLIFRWLHAKAIWSDAGRAVVATANLEPQGLDRGIELGVVLEDERSTELHGLLLGWAARASHELRVGASLGEILGKASLWQDGKFEDVEILTTVDAKSEEVIAASADRLDLPALGPVDVSRLPRPLAHEHVLTRTVMAPILDPRSKPIDGDGTSPRPQLFRDPKGRVVVAIDAPEQLDAARTLAAAHGDAPIVVDRNKSS